MKRLSAFLVFSFILLSLSACSPSPDDKGDADGAGNVNGVSTALPDIKDSRFASAAELLAGDTFSLEMEVADSETKVCRKGGDLYAVGLEHDAEVLVADNVVYTFNRVRNICYYDEINDEELDDILDRYCGFEDIISVKGGTLTNTGTAKFEPTGATLPYEEVTFSGGGVVRAFFGKDGMVGMEKNDEWIQFVVRDDPDDSVFEVPEGLEMIDYSEIEQ